MTAIHSIKPSVRFILRHCPVNNQKQQSKLENKTITKKQQSPELKARRLINLNKAEFTYLVELLLLNIYILVYQQRQAYKGYLTTL